MDEIIEIIDGTPDGETPDLSAYTAEQITEAREAIRATGAELVAAIRDADEPDPADIERLTALDAAMSAIDTFMESATDDTDTDDTPDTPSVDDIAGRFEPATDPDPEPVQASATPATRPRANIGDMVRNRPADNAPADVPTEPRVLRAAIGDGDGTGDAFADVPALGRALMNRNRNLSPREDAEVRASVARTSWDEQHRFAREGETTERIGTELFAMQREAQRQAQRDIAAVQSGDLRTMQAATLQAATGICGPAEPIYDQYGIIGTDGMFDIPALGARRGAISVPDSLSFVDFDGEEGVAFPYTSAEGAAGSKTKVCLDVACDTPTEFDVVAYSTCLTFSNFMGQFYDERVGAAGVTSLAAHAHRVNAVLIEAAATQAVTDGTSYGVADNNGGGIVQFGSNVVFHAALYRDKYRMPLGSVIDVHVPHWVADALFADALARDATTQFAAVQAQLANFLAQRNVRIRFVHDWQSLASTSPGYFPSTVDALMFPAGSVVRLTAETLDLGVVRDSTLNSNNEFRTFVETFDGIAKIGHEIMLLDDIPICPNGETGARAAITCNTGS